VPKDILGRLPTDQNKDNSIETDAKILSALIASSTALSFEEMKELGISKTMFYEHRGRLIGSGFMLERLSSTYESTELGRIYLLNLIRENPWLSDRLSIKSIEFDQSNNPSFSGIIRTRASWLPQSVVVGFSSAPSGPSGLFTIELSRSADE